MMQKKLQVLAPEKKVIYFLGYHLEQGFSKCGIVRLPYENSKACRRPFTPLIIITIITVIVVALYVPHRLKKGIKQ